MARPCLACNHAERAAIDAALVGGERAESISKRYGITKQALWRHRDAHLPKAAIDNARAEREAAEGQRGQSLLDQARALLDKSRDLLQTAEDMGDVQTALRGVREARECLGFIAKLTGEVDDGINVIINNPTFVNIQAVLLSALAPYPEARHAVVAALAAHSGDDL